MSLAKPLEVRHSAKEDGIHAIDPKHVGPAQPGPRQFPRMKASVMRPFSIVSLGLTTQRSVLSVLVRSFPSDDRSRIMRPIVATSVWYEPPVN
jgi:hypothetical protein